MPGKADSEKIRPIFFVCPGATTRCNDVIRKMRKFTPRRAGNRYITVLSMNMSMRRIVPVVSVTLLFCIGTSFFWCSDATCQGGLEDDCMCLICALAQDSDSPTSDSHHAASCSCICQMSFTAPIQVVQLSFFHSQYITSTPTFAPPKGSREVIYKPPILQVLSNDIHQTIILEEAQCGEYSFYRLS